MKKAKETLERTFRKKQIVNSFFMLVGIFIYCVGFNMFIAPRGLYSAGFVGISQLLTMGIADKVSFNIQSLVFFLINIPVFLIGLKCLGRKAITKALVVVVLQTFFMFIIPYPETFLIENLLTSCVIGGCVCGIGSGLIFYGFGSGGGTDIIGLILSRKFPGMSVGKFSIMINLVVYTLSAVLKTFEIAVYSFMISLIVSVIVDRIHQQNQSGSINIFTKKPRAICGLIYRETNRSATILEGRGAYTETSMELVVSVMSEYELHSLKHKIFLVDPDAFVYTTDHVQVLGHFEKRLSA